MTANVGAALVRRFPGRLLLRSSSSRTHRVDIRFARLAMGELEWLRFLEHMPRDDEPLHFAGSFADRAKLRVAQIALDRQIAAVAVAAVNLHGTIADFHR